MRHADTAARRRAGFTLIELLTVIAIIALLTALTAGAVFKMQARSNNNVTDATLGKLQAGLDGQFKAFLAQIEQDWSKEPYKPGYLELGGGNVVRAKVIYRKLRLRQEFPQNFAEATATTTITTAGKNTIVLSPKNAYTLAIGGTSSGAVSAQDQSAVCLALILQQARGGSAFNGKEAAPGSAKTVNLGGTNFEVFADAWGKNIGLARWVDTSILPNAGAIVTDLNLDPYVKLGSPSYDPDDPEGKLVGYTPPSSNPSPTSLIYFDGKFRGPFLFSVGPNGNAGDGDDHYGYRVKAGKKGDQP